MAKKSIVNFLKKLKVMDEVPDEIMDAACEMAEEAINEKAEDEKPEEEVTVKETRGEEKSCDEAVTKSEVEKIVSDSIAKALRDAGLVKDEAEEKLDALDEELVSNEESDEECVTEKPEAIKSNDSIRELIKVIKPEIAKVSDSKVRARLADSFAKLARIGNKTTNDYASILNAVKSNNNKNVTNDSKIINDYNVGSYIANKYNPHYKEED